MKSSINRFKRTKTNELSGMGKHALIMRLYKEVYKQLDKCEYIMQNRNHYSIAEFFSVKAKCLGKVLSIISYLIDTTDMSADKDIGEIFLKMYYYIYDNASEANSKIDISAVSRAKFMASKVVEVWDSIPESARN